MTTPQPAIFALGTPAHTHLEFDLIGPAGEIRGALARVREEITTVAGVNLVVGFGPDLWAALAPDEVPFDLRAFETITGPDGFAFPATQSDVWVWLHGASTGAVFAVARIVARELAGVAVLVREQQGFAYGASQDLTGFEDGTENPSVAEAVGIAAVPPGAVGAGGSIVLVQRWRHDLEAFEALVPEDQELVFGRTRIGSVELGPEVQSDRAHVARVVIEDEAGEELQVFRRSTPYGSVGDHGLLFVAFSADRARLQIMLERMAGMDDGIRDRVTDFSTPTSGAWYFAPPVELLV
jgi:putative iron-dependent peroxidase